MSVAPRPRILIVGCGFGGIEAVRALSKAPVEITLVDRMWPVLVTIVAALIPLSRMLPPLYTFRVRSRIFRWYRQLREVEDAIGKRPNDELLRELAEIERRVEHINVPLSYTDELYSLRTHIHMVAERLVDPAPALVSAE